MHAKTLAFIAGAGIVAASDCPLSADPLMKLEGTNAVYSPWGGDAGTPIKGSAFTIVYDGTGLGPLIDVVLGKGPPTNVVPIGFIVKGAANCGHDKCEVSWTPDCSLEDTNGAFEGYGLRVIDQGTCKYQWTGQFGIKKGSTCGTTAPSSSVTVPQSSRSGPKPSDAPKPSDKYEHPPKPSATASDCDEDDSYPTGHPKPDGYPKPAPSGYTGGKGDDGYYYPPSNGTAYQPPSVSGGTTKPSYTPLQSNDAAGLAINAVSALVVLATSFMLL